MTSPGSDTAEIARVEAAVRALFGALTTEDGPALADLVSPGFYAFDGGRRVDTDGLLALVCIGRR